jgi:NAD(P)-dependent dehydrogenase (short-subunit alcohol dehydrogenase family)
MMKLKGRVALVTGSGRGIGAAIAARLGDGQAKVVVNDIDTANVEARVADLRDRGVEPMGYVADVTGKPAVQQMVQEVLGRFGRLDILVNNVGIERDALIHKLSEEDWDRVIEVNLKSYFLCTQAAVVPMMEQGYGRIINISSRAWLGGFGQSNYSASKGGIISLTRTLAIELARYGITANAIAPGLIDTPLFRSFRRDVQERLLKMQPTGVIGQPEDVAYAVAFFASDEASYITGQTLYVCGGKSVAVSGA